jgi:hypothetical protein
VTGPEVEPVLDEDDDSHEIEDCDDIYCEEHWQSYHVEIEQRVEFDVRIRNDRDADESAWNYEDIVTVSEPRNTEGYIETFDEGSYDMTIESEEERRRNAAEYRRRLAEWNEKNPGEVDR